jgi:hypothetical protein
MLRKAVPSDLWALKSVRSSVVENVLADATKVTDDDSSQPSRTVSIGHLLLR